MRLGVRGDLFENRRQPKTRAPLPGARRKRRVQHHPRNVESTWARVAGDRVRTESLVAPLCQLSERHAVLHAAGYVDDVRACTRRAGVQLLQDLSLIHISEPTRLLSISYAVFCLKKK